MAYLINPTYFIKELTIPNANQTQIVGSADNFNQWIDKEARLVLQRALGYDRFSELDALIDGNGDLPSSSPQKWRNLVYGETYSYQSRDLHWKGLVFTEGSFKGSLLAHYVYAKWLEFQLSKQSGFGESRGVSVNSVNQNSTHRYVYIWNSFLEMYQGDIYINGFDLYREQLPRISYKRNIRFVDYAGNNYSTYVSLLEYLTHKEDVFPDTDRYIYEYLNTMGI